MKFPLRVLYLDHTSQWSGGEISLYRLLVSLDQEIVKPIVILPMDGMLCTQLREAGIETHLVELDKKWINFRKESLGYNIFALLLYICVYFKYALSIRHFLNEKNIEIDIVHSNSLKSDIYGYFTSFILRKKCIWHIRDHINKPYLTRIIAVLFRQFAKYAPDAIIANSKSTANVLDLNNFGIEFCRIVYDGILNKDLEGIDPRIFLKWKQNPVRIGMLGRIARWKGQHIFIEAAVELTKRGFDAEYFIVGSTLFGEDEYLDEINKKSQIISGKMNFMGFRSDVKDILTDLDILVHCSILPEPFGQVVLEGMAEGLPIVASDAGGVQEIIEQNISGLRTPPGDPIELANALQQLIENPDFASSLGQEAYRCVRQKFTATQAARKVESLYRELVTR